MIKKLLFCLIFSHLAFSQTDFQNLTWEYRGPQNIDLGVKSIIDFTQDPITETKVWACSVSDGLLVNDDITNPQSLWKKSNLPTSKAYKIRFHPSNPKIAFALTDYRIWKSTDAGNSWAEIDKSLPESRYQDIWISKKGIAYFKTQNEIYASSDGGFEFRQIYSNQNGLKIKQLWVQENERVYILLANDSGKYTDDLFRWTEISLAQMQKEEFPLPIYEEFHGYIVENGQQFHGYTTIRKNIIVGNRYSTDGGTTYKNFLIPENTKEAIFVKDEIYFATEQGIWKWNNNALIEINNGILNGEWKNFTIRENAGDNYLVGLTTNGLFFHAQKGIATEFIKATDKKEYFYQIYPFLNTNYAAVEEGKYGFTGANYFEAKKLIPISDKEVLLLDHKGFMERWIASKTGNTQDGIFEHLENGVKPIVDILHHTNSKLISILFEDGVFERFDPKKWQVLLRQKKFNTPFYEGIIEELSNDGKQLLVSDKKNGLWYSLDEGVSWKQINLSFTNNLKINHLEFLFRNQTLVLATDTGLYFGENITTENPKWTLDKSLGLQPILHIQYRESDEYLAVLTKNKGIFTTNVFSKPNQIITQSFDFLNEQPNSFYYLAVPNGAYICSDSKIRVHFTTNIAENPNINYFVEVSDDNQNYPEKPFILEGTSTKSPIEVVFRKPQDKRNNGFRIRVIAKGNVNAVGTSTAFMTSDGISTSQTQKPFIGYAYSPNVCLVDSFKIFTDFNQKYRYQWQKDGVLLQNEGKNQIIVRDRSNYRASIIYDNGCMVSTDEIRLKTCETATENRAILINPPIISANKTQFYTSEKGILKTEGCANVNFQWMKENQPIASANLNILDVKESGNYSLKIEKFGCSATSNSIKIIVENVLSNEIETDFEVNVYPNPTTEKLIIDTQNLSNELFSVKINDISSRLVKEWKIDASKNELDLSDLQAGIYFLTIQHKNKKIVKKIIIH